MSAVQSQIVSQIDHAVNSHSCEYPDCRAPTPGGKYCLGHIRAMAFDEKEEKEELAPVELFDGQSLHEMEKELEDQKKYETIPQHKKFRAANARWFLTYKTQIPKDLMRKHLERLNPTKGEVCKEIVIAHEVGEKNSSTPYPHTHVYVQFSKAKNVKDCRTFDYTTCEGEVIHPHIRRCRTRTNKFIYRYLSKEDPENSHLKVTQKNSILPMEIVRMCEGDILRVAEYIKSPNDITGYIKLCELYKTVQDSKYIDYEPTGWQLDVMRELSFPADLRKISWYWEPVGRVGKSQLIRHLMAKYPEHILAIQNPGLERDVSTLFCRYLDSKQWNGTAIVINLSRKYATHTTIASTLESLKDGLMTAQKYQGQTASTPGPPHVIVFANWRPNIYDEHGKHVLSADRWNIRRIPVTTLDRSAAEKCLRTPGIPMDPKYAKHEYVTAPEKVI